MSTSQSPPRKRVRNNATNSSQQLNSGQTHFQPSSSNPNSNANLKSKNELQPEMIDEETAGAPTGSAGIEVRKARVAKAKNGAGRKVRHSEKVGSSSSSSSSSEGEEEFDLLEGCDLSAAILRKVPRLGQDKGSGLSEVEGEVVRLIGQYLSSVGLKNSAAVLMAEAGCRLDQPTASLFRKCVLNGEWSSAVNTLEELKHHLEVPSNVAEMKFMLLEQKYLELLYQGNAIEALKVLQTEITPLKHNQRRTHELSSYLMFSTREDLVRVASSSTDPDITSVNSRRQLMERLQDFLPASVMLPPKRLQTLLNQAAEFQIERCLYHNKSPLSPATVDNGCSMISSTNPRIDSSFLAVDHQCSREMFPCETVQILSDHCEEVWYTKFSPDGLKLATGSKDNTVIIWDYDPEAVSLKQNKVLDRNTQGVSFFAWSPDSTRLAVCGPEDCDEIYIWNVETGAIESKISHSTEDALQTVSWSPDGRKICCGGQRGQFYECDSKGTVNESWEGVRVKCLAYRKDGKSVLAADTHNRIRSYNFEGTSDHHVLQEDHGIMTFTVDENDRYALLNVANQGLHLWDIEEKVLIRKYYGMQQGFYCIYSCFGGADQNFIASGSENSNIYIFHVKREEAICVLTGHMGSVNCVAWNPVYPNALVSCSDDSTVRLWGPAKKYRSSPATANGAPFNGATNGSV